MALNTNQSITFSSSREFLFHIYVKYRRVSINNLYKIIFRLIWPWKKFRVCFFCLFVRSFSSHSRIFHSYGDDTIAGANFDLCTALMAIEQRVSSNTKSWVLNKWRFFINSSNIHHQISLILLNVHVVTFYNLCNIFCR